ncbi:hypothetical protein PRIPAC_95347 [Pristionchus pacificus]|uniref:Uncharacterized protein n=1 Tax=Pristionchus pacificus TaxID=54126 RepID=A0A2A6B2V1_PRIPA|nr:hypothetical protein PRIPAC_95347 [Pristionchus pacificus]|eukprot:PDM60183.1 hypothetical protein PRIPAC_54008 [Pristionchus pacificus]
MSSFLFSESFKPLFLLVVTLIVSEVVLVSTIGLVCFDRDDAAIREYLERNHASQETIDLFDPETPYLQYITYRIFIVIGRVFVPTESLLINCLLQMAIHLTSVILSIGITILIGLCIGHFESNTPNYHRL